MNPLQEQMELAREEFGGSMLDYTVLSENRDPYRLSTPAGHAKGRWLADAYAKVNPEGRRLHLRGLHYAFVGRVTKPNGLLYTNTDKTWKWVSEDVAKCARFLGYLPWDALRDARNSPPQVFLPEFNYPTWQLSAGDVELVVPEVLEPRFYLSGDVVRQPWQQVVIAEKQGVEDLLKPVCAAREATLCLPSGELSDQMLYDLLLSASNDGRPLAIHQLGDFDPAGWQMAISTARTAQALTDTQFPGLDLRVHAIGLTKEHCVKWQLPSTPLKKSESRAERWMDRMGWEQTELDAAVALAPDEFSKVVDDSLLQYFDPDLYQLGAQLKGDLEETENERLAEQLGTETIARIRTEAESKVEALDDLVVELRDALTIDPEDAGIQLPDSPTVLIGETDDDGAQPLFDSEEDWATASRRLIARKRYA